MVFDLIRFLAINGVESRTDQLLGKPLGDPVIMHIFVKN